MGEDLSRRRLANRKVGIYALLFLVHAYLVELTLGQVGGHLVIAGLAFLVFLGLFVIGAMSGGDVKLGAAVMLWAGPSFVIPTVAVIAWSGGVVAVLGWLVDLGWTRREACASRSLNRWRQALSARRGVPYGVALAAGGLYVLWQRM